MELYSQTAADEAGNIVNGASVSVTVASSGAPATIYDKDGGALGNPFLTGYDRSKGEVEFQATNDLYNIVVAGNPGATKKNQSLNDITDGAIQVVSTVAVLRTIAPNTSRNIRTTGAVTANIGGHDWYAVTGASPGTYTGKDNIGTIVEFTGGDGSSAWLSSNVIHFNLKEFGAIGDDAANDYTPIQAAIVAAEAVNGMVYAPAGVYNYESGLSISEAITFAGEDERGTVLKKNGNFIGLTTTKGCTLRDFTLDSAGGTDAAQGLHVTSATYRSRALRLTVTNQGGHGIEIFSSNLGTYEDLTILGNNGDGILLNGNATPDVNAAVFKNIDTRGNQGIGFNIDNAWNTLGYGITAQSNVGGGVRLNNSRASKLDVYVENNGGNQLELTNHANCKGSIINVVYDGSDPVVDNSTGFNEIHNTRRGSVYDANHYTITSEEFRQPNTDKDGASLLGSWKLFHSSDSTYSWAFDEVGADQTLNIFNVQSGKVVNLTIDGSFTAKKIVTPEEELPDGATTPNVSGSNQFITANTGATVITQLLGGVSGQEICIIFNDSNTTISSNTTIRLSGGVNFVGSSRDTLTLRFSSVTGDWHEVSRSVNA